jgi:hypothetical protein
VRCEAAIAGVFIWWQGEHRMAGSRIARAAGSGRLPSLPGASMTSEPKPFSDYAAFWPFYLSQHSRRTTRLVHVTGTCLALLALVTGIASGSIGWLLMAPVIGYGVAWIAHAFIEKNRPATFTYPLWSLRGDFHMLWLWLTGRLEIEAARCGITT